MTFRRFLRVLSALIVLALVGEQWKAFIPGTHVSDEVLADSSASQTATQPAATQSARQPATKIPYHIDRRPMPPDAEIDTLAPKKVGPFQRLKIEDTAGHEPGDHFRYVKYSKPGETHEAVVIGVFVHATPAAAQIDLAGQDHDATLQESLHSDPSYYRVPNALEGAEFYWTRGRYGFLLQAWHGEADLDEFMKSFPY